MIAIVADTPYQLMSAIMVADHVAPGDKIIFFINTYLYFKEQAFHYSDAHPRVEKILYYGRKHMGAGKLLAGLMNPRSMLKHIDGYDPGMDFTALISSRTTYMATYLYNEYARRHPSLPVYLVEEGIGEYTTHTVHTRFTRACAALGRKTHMDRITAAYFSAPSLYPYPTYFPVEKIPAPTGSSREIIESVFRTENLQNPLDARHCVFLTEPNSIELKRKGDAAEYDAIEDAIMDTAAVTAGLSDTVIKVHPIDPNFQKEGVETYRSQYPMELLLFTMTCADKVFLSTMSTAMLTPKLLFDEEPRLIFTYKMVAHFIEKIVPDDAQRRRYYDFIDGVIAMYRDPARCALPANLGELRDTVADFTAKARNETPAARGRG